MDFINYALASNEETTGSKPARFSCFLVHNSDAYALAGGMAFPAFFRLVFAMAVWCFAYATTAILMSVRFFNSSHASLN
ncbi:hypothetical protein Cni_G14778 [Canna indica]|uniref:Uncharacterized protein n=1 Tax=Canna indica TaxID=4628 RepID=A0AAQ3QE51_9LILI|nr:hypothetical protein Cni_G14778 [Canna indica]